MPERPTPALDNPSIPSLESLKSLKRQDLIPQAQIFLSRITSILGQGLLKTTPEEYKAESQYLNTLARTTKGRLDMEGHEAISADDPDYLWRAVHVLYPKKEALNAYYIIQSAQIVGMGGIIKANWDAVSIHNLLTQEKNTKVLERLNQRQIILGENASLKVLNDQLKPLSEVDKDFQKRITYEQETLDYYLYNLREGLMPPSSHHIELSKTIMRAGISPASRKFQELASTYEEKGFDDIERAMGEIARALKEGDLTYYNHQGKLTSYPEAYVTWFTAQWQPFLALVHKFKESGCPTPVVNIALNQYKHNLRAASEITQSTSELPPLDILLNPDDIKLGPEVPTERYTLLDLESGKEIIAAPRENLDIYIRSEALDLLRKDLTERGSRLEAGGVVLGHIGIDPETQKGQTRITHYTPCLKGLPSIASFRFTPDAWREAIEALDSLKEQLDDPVLRIVGWVHSHPQYGVFLSEADDFVNKFFQEPGQVAIVFDPVQNQLGVFSKGGSGKEYGESYRQHGSMYITSARSQ